MAERRFRIACLMKVHFRSINVVSPHTHRRRCELDCVHPSHCPTHCPISKNFCLGTNGVYAKHATGSRITSALIHGGSEFERARSIGHDRSSHTDGHVLFRSVETRACEPDHGSGSLWKAMIRLTRICIIHSHSHFRALDSCLDERTMTVCRTTHFWRPSGPSQDWI